MTALTESKILLLEPFLISHHTVQYSYTYTCLNSKIRGHDVTTSGYTNNTGEQNNIK
jgi:hypothetical protein